MTTSPSTASAALDVVTVAEAAALMRCKPWPVLKLVRSGRLPASRPVGDAGPWLIRRDALAELLAAS
jgi:excisionase family DNA binding protein